jgi:hypothetical protein
MSDQSASISQPLFAPAKAVPPSTAVRTKLLLEGPTLPTLLRLAAPNILVLLAFAGMITFDGFFLGRIGTNALAGASLAFPCVMMVLQTTNSGMGVGVSSAVARALGAGRRDRANGGLGILIGDGQLPHPGLEHIIKAYYSYALTSATRLSFDYQFIDNPAYNTDRGPVSFFLDAYTGSTKLGNSYQSWWVYKCGRKARGRIVSARAANRGSVAERERDAQSNCCCQLATLSESGSTPGIELARSARLL